MLNQSKLINKWASVCLLPQKDASMSHFLIHYIEKFKFKIKIIFLIKNFIWIGPKIYPLTCPLPYHYTACNYPTTVRHAVRVPCRSSVRFSCGVLIRAFGVGQCENDVWPN